MVPYKPLRVKFSITGFWQQAKVIQMFVAAILSPMLDDCSRKIRAASYYRHEVERTLNKLSLREQGRSPLKYTNCRLCIRLEEKFLV
jgi:hypothetical protein